MPYYDRYQKKNTRGAGREEAPRSGRRSGHEEDESPERRGGGRPAAGRSADRTAQGKGSARAYARGNAGFGRSYDSHGREKADRSGRPYDGRVRESVEHSGRPGTARPAEPPRHAAPAPQRTSPQPAPRPAFETPYTREPENLLSGRNPIREALKADRDIEKMLVAKGDLSGSAREIVAMARERGIPVQVVDRARLDEITPHHQGILAYASAYQYAEVEDILALAKARGEQPFVVVLDGITDPHNLGAIIRTAACAGAHGVIVPLRRSVGLTPAAVKASAGAVETVRVARVTNLTQTLRRLKQEGLWIYAADMSGEDYRTVRMEQPMALVIGSEGEGVSRLVLENADFVVRLPVLGAVDSLNASVAAGILMYHTAFAAKHAE